MKKLSNKKLAVGAVLCFVIAIFLDLMWLEIIPDFGISVPLKGNVALVFSVFPFFLLQTLLCRINKNTKWLPVGCIATIATGCGIAFALSSGWDSLGWMILLIMCIPPAFGIVAGFLYYRIFENKNTASK